MGGPVNRPAAHDRDGGQAASKVPAARVGYHAVCLSSTPDMWGEMRLGSEPVGRWGIALLSVTAVAGFALAAHGWSARAAGSTPGLASGSRPPAAAGGPAPAASTPVAGPSAPASPTASAPPATHAGHGPKLSSEPYASAAFLIWPGTPGAAARQALAGIRVSVHRQGSALAVAATVNGQSAGPAQLYRDGARVYVVEASMGDDSGNSDYSLGDDGLVVTDSQGRLVQ